ncbi:hypothetical protein L6452_41253 [Arctium lappa]|uniref:Uncharacterized protein n=1 Tax=Arctium lappa TaxID=4217 RepID=A0ACB8XQE5_ARCLA|nr:hypothetical protein L6452_41253 [Arctium lappa]
MYTQARIGDSCAEGSRTSSRLTWTRFGKTQGMRTGLMPYRGTLSALRRIAQEEVVLYLADISHIAIQFPAYEKIKSYLASRENIETDKLGSRDVVVASSVSKVFASTLTYPHEGRHVNTIVLLEDNKSNEVRY